MTSVFNSESFNLHILFVLSYKVNSFTFSCNNPDISCGIKVCKYASTFYRLVTVFGDSPPHFLCGFPRMRADLFSPEIEPSISIVGMLLNLIHQVSENVVAKKKEEEKKHFFP